MRSRAMRKATRRYLWDRMKVSLWFMPLVMALGAVLVSWLLSRFDNLIPNQFFYHSMLMLAGTPSEMRAIMIGVSGTVLATAGVVFSLITLPLSTVASQFGSRLLRVFMRDRTTQLVLGMFVSTFCYCLVTALSIPSTDLQAAAPQITVTFGLLLMLLTFASLIILIQHISTMLQAPNIVAAAGSDLIDVIGLRDTVEEFIKPSVSNSDSNNIGSLIEKDAFTLKASKTGYIQFIDPDIILNLAEESDLKLRLLRKPGHFILSGEVAALVWPADKVNARLAKHLLRSIKIGNQRTPTQDIEYGINQLAEIAVRAMSPAINDPFTAMTCLDHLANGLAKFVEAGDSNPNFYDKKGQLRLIFEPATLEELLEAAFNMLRHASCDNANVLLHMLDVIEIIGLETNSLVVCQELRRHAQLILAESQAGALIEMDRQRIASRYQMIEMKLEEVCTRSNG